MTIYGLLCGLTNYPNIVDFIKLKAKYFIKLLNLENRTPSYDCLPDLLQE